MGFIGNTPFIKEDGCNKMTCTKAGCRNVQCYVCSKSCGYNHFDRPERGGKAGNCPLFDDVVERHAKEVEKAETETKRKVLEENPGLEPEFLDLDFSSKVKEDEARQLERTAARRNPYERPPRRDNDQQPQVNDLINGFIRDDEGPNLLNQDAVGIWYEQQRQYERRQQQLQQARQAQQQAQQAHQQAQQARQQARQARQQAHQQAQQAHQQAQQAQQQAHQQAQQMQMQALEAMKNHIQRPILDRWQKFMNHGHVPMPIRLAPEQQGQPVPLQPGLYPASVEPHLQQGSFPPMPNPNP